MQWLCGSLAALGTLAPSFDCLAISTAAQMAVGNPHSWGVQVYGGLLQGGGWQVKPHVPVALTGSTTPRQHEIFVCVCAQVAAMLEIAPHLQVLDLVWTGVPTLGGGIDLARAIAAALVRLNIKRAHTHTHTHTHVNICK
jgi:hypothetical protein